MKPSPLKDKKRVATLKKENLQLKKAIKHIAVSLIEKERELEIETALEKVRAIALSMKEPADMLKVCSVISQQLKSLGVKEIRNVQTAVFYESRRTYMNYEYYSKQRKSIVTETSYANHKLQKTFAQKMMSGKGEFFATHIKGIKVKEWLAYQKTTNVFIDRFLEKASSLNYYWHSLGPVALGFSSYEPLTKTELELFSRFLKVFELAYTRYLDIEQAQLQAKEARIEAALERIRARALAMNSSDELIDVAKVLREQMGLLGQPELETSAVQLYEEDPENILSWRAFRLGSAKEGEITYSHISIPKHCCVLIEEILNKFYSEQSDFTVEVSGAKQAEWYKVLFKLAPEFYSAMKKSNSLTEKRYYHLSKFSGGALLMIASQQPSPESIYLQRRSAEVFDLAYRRFLDLKKAEAQVKEAKIQLALERVRARTMSMQKSEELADVATLLFQQFKNLGLLPDIARVFFNLIDEKSESSEVWTTKEDGILRPGSHRISLNTNNHLKSVFASWKAKTPLYIGVLYGEEVIDYFNYLSKMPDLKEDKILQLGLISPPDKLVFTEAFFKQGTIGIVSADSLLPESQNTLKRFAIAFEQTYTRFLDLQKAEAQAREAQIEAALERVRSRSMGMQKSEELKEVIKIVYQQLKLLKINLDHAGFVVDYMSKGDWHFWIADERDIPSKISHPFFDSVWANQFNEAKEKGIDLFVTHLNFEEKNKFYKELLSFVPDLPVAAKDFYLNCPALAASTVLLDDIGLYIENFDGIPYTHDENDTLLRFGKVFQQTYTRFLDLQKAEAQAREARIEYALEKVRSRTMAMQKSEELHETSQILFQQMKELGEPVEQLTIGIVKETENVVEVFATVLGSQLHQSFRHSIDEPTVMNKIYRGWKSQKKSLLVEMNSDEIQLYNRYRNELVKSEMFSTAVSKDEQRIIYAAYFSKGMLALSSNTPLSEESHRLLERFAGVFDGTYTRFLDLQKAEAQAREAKIEYALEKVRSRTMAMQHSDELPAAANLLFLEVQALGIPSWSAGYNILAEDKKSSTCIMSSEGQIQSAFHLPFANSGESSFAEWLEAIETGQSFFVQELSGKAIEVHYGYMKTLPQVGQVLKELEDAGLSLPTYQINHLSFFNGGFLLFITYEQVPLAHDIFKRFTKVFEQTYTRFLDLQKAEAQAREAKIEAALERVRSKTMAMQKSEDLSETAFVLFQQLKELGENPERIFISTFDDHEKNIVDIWGTTQGGNQLNKLFKVAADEPTVIAKIVAAWKEEKKSVVVDLSGNELSNYFQFLKNAGIPVAEDIITDRRVQTAACFSKGVIGLTTQETIPQDSVQLLERFAGVFDLTYTRFLDLQNAEAQTHKAKIETALERVRARALAMQQPEELKEVAEVLRYEMGLLGVEELETCSIYINDVHAEKAECWYALKDLRSTEKKLVNDHFALDLNDTWVGRQMLQFYNSSDKRTSIVMQGANRKEWISYCEEKSVYLRGYYGVEIPDRTYHLYKFSHGAIGAAAVADISAESWSLLKRASSVFSLAYSRFKDLSQARTDLIKLKEEKKRAEDALTELQVTQKQLIQSEKMASLGELTAGIAHEIQNPLNFVNNFSEVSKELLDEMKQALEKGDAVEAKEIMNDVIQNLEKINHHGKRADGIVKGMLLHSRSSSGVKEPTDINALCDEYLRLSYHGLRAKDKSFNATINTDFDESIGSINIIPQDIGRVVLNLLTNAFYACTEFSDSGTNKAPTVWVSTRKEGDKILVSVQDNGPGIPPKILDKIFQPFFTTKPTGQGTGLGLSLSYDIVTKGHGGELKVETKEGEGTTFIISFPTNSN